jgi:anti-anti-sigma factor
MPLSRLGVASERRADLVLIALSGELDVYTVHDFWERTRHYDPAEVQMVIDLGGVTLIDAAGLGALVSLCNAARRDRARIGVVCPQRRLQQVFWATGLRSAFVLGPDLATVAPELATPADPT